MRTTSSKEAVRIMVAKSLCISAKSPLIPNWKKSSLRRRGSHRSEATSPVRLRSVKISVKWAGAPSGRRYSSPPHLLAPLMVRSTHWSRDCLFRSSLDVIYGPREDWVSCRQQSLNFLLAGRGIRGSHGVSHLPEWDTVRYLSVSHRPRWQDSSIGRQYGCGFQLFWQDFSGNSLRQGKPWQGGSDELKPCTASQQVRHLSGKGAARQPEASVAWRAATHVVKRTQRVAKRRY